MTELILKTVNGEGATGDMRIIVFSSELLFTLILVILMVFEPWITPCLQSCTKSMQSRRAAAAGSQNQESQNAGADSATGSNQNQNQNRNQNRNQNQNQNPAESHEMNSLLNTQNQENSRSDGTEEAQPDSVVSQS
ncbi:probable serine/threonine-protein kinase DDB_G0279405 isoform X1 [Carassius auratus]|uniref:Probable serine/threonine-protein kinase DDB_G0279405 isoform X1 n=1 Tax=Carassius auratus TaxID=7957 RepID=A0A6P6NNL1_CARAU|nr:probable serine/threonine-protein kinase DDB_G0279405 isoform X1 [Carassius auratus]